jgi:hypothetical protein
MAIWTLGLRRNRTVLPRAGGGSAKTTGGGVRSSTITSVTVAARLATDQVLRGHGPDRAEHLGLLVPDRLVVRTRGSLHGEVAHDLEEVALDDVADDARLLVTLAPSPDAEALGHGDLDVLDVVAVPDGFQEGVGEAEVEDVLDRHPRAAVELGPARRSTTAGNMLGGMAR